MPCETKLKESKEQQLLKLEQLKAKYYSPPSALYPSPEKAPPKKEKAFKERKTYRPQDWRGWHKYELQNYCKELGLKGYSGACRKELEKILDEAGASPDWEE
jgi:hypothetical protein